MSRTTRCLEKYSVPESGKPILCGHVFAQLIGGISLRKVHGWACAHNAQNNFPDIDFNYLSRKRNIYNSRNRGTQHFLLFERTCGEVMKFKAPTASQEAPMASREAPTISQAAPTASREAPQTYDMHACLRNKVAKQSQTILQLRKKLKGMDQFVKQLQNSLKVKKSKKSKKFQELLSRELHDDCLVKGVPAKHVSELLQSIVQRFQDRITS